MAEVTMPPGVVNLVTASDPAPVGKIFLTDPRVRKLTFTGSTQVGKMLARGAADQMKRVSLELVDPAALSKVARQVADAVDKGATLVEGGRQLTEDGLDRGNFYAPTILSGITPDMIIYRQETFGPVAPIIAFDDDDDVLAMANDTTYGLASYVYTRNLARAMKFFEGLRFGIVGINDINPTAAAAPFGGMKESGLGREGALEGIGEYLETKLGGFSIK